MFAYHRPRRLEADMQRRISTTIRASAATALVAAAIAAGASTASAQVPAVPTDPNASADTIGGFCDPANPNPSSFGDLLACIIGISSSGSNR
ncbi:hypothetical protein [Nocardia sp. NPDC048505]|uniref:hypothetical protein n=1 Tax=unclassified Nocardia TaxID=2637762 RepID=UPI0033C2FE15